MRIIFCSRNEVWERLAFERGDSTLRRRERRVFGAEEFPWASAWLAFAMFILAPGV